MNSGNVVQLEEQGVALAIERWPAESPDQLKAAGSFRWPAYREREPLSGRFGQAGRPAFPAAAEPDLMLGHVRLPPPAPPPKTIAGFANSAEAPAAKLRDSFRLWYGLYPINSL